MLIEIGTSDFRTQAGITKGIFIEPVKYYFDRLPECNKLNVAISNYEGSVNVFYLHEDDIKRHDMPQWLRGCNSIGEPHPTVVSELLKRNLIPSNMITVEPVRVVRIESIIDEFCVTNIDHLKIDTEGHDCIILNDFLDTVDILPEMITFEANVLSDKKEVDKVLKRLISRGYHCRLKADDYICELL